MTVCEAVRRNWRTLVGAALGAVLGALYAHFIGCRTGTCAITSHVWTAALFFGLTGAVIGLPGRGARPREDGDATRGPAPP